MSKDVDILVGFLSLPVESSVPVFEMFDSLPGAEVRQNLLFPKEKFTYVEGTRENKVLLVAHADTFWDSAYGIPKVYYEDMEWDQESVSVITKCKSGIGADDRAGCAILWLLKDLGHSLLITDGEEKGGIGSTWLMYDEKNRDIADRINNNHQFIIQFDRRGGKDFKCYNVGTEEFRSYIHETLNYTEPDRSSGTDIVNLCRSIPGVNLSIGYYDEHTEDEYVVVNEWLNTLELCRNWLSKEDLPKFELNEKYFD